MHDVHERLTWVFDTLLQSVLGPEGYGGPVHHSAQVGDIELWFRQSDFGDVSFSATTSDNVEVWMLTPKEQWHSVAKKGEGHDLGEMTKLAEDATWVDHIKRKTDE